MANKLYNTHLYRLMTECKQYYILDCYISLVHIATEIDNKFIIQTYSNSKADLINCIKDNIAATYKTISNCIDKLISLNFISYDEYKEAWIINDMEYMVLKKDPNLSKEEAAKYSGYTYIRPLFLTNNFNKMKLNEKKVLIYMSQLCDSNSGKFYKTFEMDLNNKNSKWYTILNTSSKYYAEKIMKRMFSKYSDIISNITEKKDYLPKKIQKFRFSFISDTISQKFSENTSFDLVTILHPNEYTLVKENIKSFDIQLSKTKIMHLVRAIINIKNWLLKERVVNIILKKYKAIQYYNSREDIKSLPKYAAAVVKTVIDEYKFAQYRLNNKTIHYDSDKEISDSIYQNIALF